MPGKNVKIQKNVSSIIKQYKFLKMIAEIHEKTSLMNKIKYVFLAKLQTKKFSTLP